MKILVESGIVESRQDGKWTHYNISEQGSRDAIDILKELTSISDTNKNGNCCNNN
jgi:ArsR family transcriptional regulator